MDKQKGVSSILIIVGILVLVGVAGGAYFLGKSGKPQPLVSQPQSTPQPTSLPQASASGETANWKTYTLRNLNFKIPQDLWAGYNKNADVSLESYLLNPQPLPIPSDASPALILFVQNNTKLDDKKQEKIKYTYLVNITTKEFNASDGDGIILEGMIQLPKGIDVPLPVGKIDRTAFFQKGTDLYILNETGEEYKTLFNQILSTFRFTK